MKRAGTTFGDIIGIVHKPGSHQLTARRASLHKKKIARIKRLGVRPLSSAKESDDDLTEGQRRLYRQAYKALKNSKKRWATESEVNSIIYGNKKMSRERSAAVIEVMRKAGVTGFRETDEVTSGTVYSERVMNVIKKKKKQSVTDERRKTIARVKAQDARFAKDMDIDAGVSAGEPERGATVVKIQSGGQEPEYYTGRQPQYSTPQKTTDASDTANPKAHLEIKKPKRKKSNKDRPEKVPLKFDTSDM